MELTMWRFGGKRWRWRRWDTRKDEGTGRKSSRSKEEHRQFARGFGSGVLLQNNP